MASLVLDQQIVQKLYSLQRRMCVCCACVHVFLLRDNMSHIHTQTRRQVLCNTLRRMRGKETAPVSVLVKVAVCGIGQWRTTTSERSSSHVDNKINSWHSSPVLSIRWAVSRPRSFTRLAGLKWFDNFLLFNYNISTDRCYKYLQVVLWD